MINFCLFCLSAREVRSAMVNALNQLCHRLSTKRATRTLKPEVKKFTVDTPNTGLSPRYGAMDSIIVPLIFIYLFVAMQCSYMSTCN